MQIKNRPFFKRRTGSSNKTKTKKDLSFLIKESANKIFHLFNHLQKFFWWNLFNNFSILGIFWDSTLLLFTSTFSTLFETPLFPATPPIFIISHLLYFTASSLILRAVKLAEVRDLIVLTLQYQIGIKFELW